MTVPTVAVLVTLGSPDNQPYAGVVIRARLDLPEIYQGIIVSDEVTATTNASGVATLNLFPNAPFPTGLGTQGSTYVVKASIPGARNLHVRARIPNSACNLEDVLVDDDAEPLLVAELMNRTGTGSLVFNTGPTLVSPTISGATLTSPTISGATLTSPTISSPTISSATISSTTINTSTINSPNITSPTLVTPVLGTPASGTLTNCTGLPISTGVSGLATGVAAFLATPSSANLATAVTNETGSGALVFGTSPTLNSPTLVTPALGTPASGTLTNCTGLPASTGISGLGTGVATFLGTSTTTSLAGRLIGVQRITATNVYTPTAGTNSVIVELVGGGGGGGGCPATAGGQIAAASGGGAGGYTKSRILSGFSGVTVTIGAGGTAGVGVSGGSGGTTSFGAVCSATGGSGGGVGVAVTSTVVAINAGGGGGGLGSSGTLINAAGAAGGHASFLGVGVGGAGGASLFGAGGNPTAGGANGVTSNSLGAGGSGSSLGASSAANTGGLGAQGLCIVWEYA